MPLKQWIALVGLGESDLTRLKSVSADTQVPHDARVKGSSLSYGRVEWSGVVLQQPKLDLGLERNRAPIDSPV